MRLLSFKAITLAVIVAIIFILFQYTQQENKAMPTPQNVTLHFGQQGVEDFTTYTGGNVDVQPAGMSFFDLDWTPPNLGTVSIAHGGHTLTIDNAFSVLGNSKNNNVSKGIIGISINSGLNKAEFVEPKEAYLAYKELLTRINQSGWQQYYTNSEPRISELDNLKFINEHREVIDSSYILTYEEWLNVFKNDAHQDLNFNLYLDGIILWVWLRKADENEKEEEQYMLRFSFETAGYVDRNVLESGFDLNGAALRAAHEKNVEEDLGIRSTRESELIEEGYRIKKNYETPDSWKYMQ
ncbi:hypothetical protein ACT3TI_13615 [Psychrobacter sp. AOP22-C1-22]|uniref:hypothetical protein n=1 Tax=unclassified Psychrobacter TaxID=196806 RepID=UPI001788190D|nr:hypothetical protein [Psychrobacter sp. FME6]MBE0407937.1 hypothetical protein [Psychrobacter sp. FME6]